MGTLEARVGVRRYGVSWYIAVNVGRKDWTPCAESTPRLEQKGSGGMRDQRREGQIGDGFPARGE